MEKGKIFSRREFLKAGLGFITGVGLASCAPETRQPTQELKNQHQLLFLLLSFYQPQRQLRN